MCIFLLIARYPIVIITNNIGMLNARGNSGTVGEHKTISGRVPCTGLPVKVAPQFSVMVPEFEMAPKLEMVPELVTVTPGGTVTVIPAGIVTVLPELIVIGGVAPPHVAESSQLPLLVAMNVVACALCI